MTTLVTVQACCGENTVVLVDVFDGKTRLDAESVMLKDGEKTQNHVFDARFIEVREVPADRMVDDDQDSTVERDLSPVQLSPEGASSNIKRDNSLLFAEKFLEFNENIVVHDEAVNSLQIELEQMAQEIIAINRSTDTLQA